MAKQTNTVRQLIQQQNPETGEVIDVHKVSILPKEPNFVKLYLDDILLLNDVPKWISSILHELLKYMNYQNEIVLNAYVKKQIAAQLNVIPRTVDNALLAFTKKEILFRKGPGVYVANPYLFGKGDWSNIQKIRLEIEWTPNGKRMKAVIEKEEMELENA